MTNFERLKSDFAGKVFGMIDLRLDNGITINFIDVDNEVVVGKFYDTRLKRMVQYEEDLCALDVLTDSDFEQLISKIS